MSVLIQCEVVLILRCLNCLLSQLPVVELLVSHGADLETARTSNGESPVGEYQWKEISCNVIIC